MLPMQSDDALLLRLMISDAAFLTTKEKSLLQNNLDSSARLALMSIDDISIAVKRAFSRATWNGKECLKKAQRAAKIIRAFGIEWTACDRFDFPAMLTEMTDPPYMLFYRGNLAALKNQCVSVVGTRRATVGARKAAEQFGHDAAADGTTVVSGLAFGIDICAHKGALETGATAAVLPCGIDTIAPPAHTKYAQRILQNGGLLISEYIPGTPAAAFRFVQRNRIVAALSPATVVIQAPSGSGALITASLALGYGRDVMLHEEAFSRDAELVEKANLQNLKAQIAMGKKVSSKIQYTVQRYREDGAPVIANYAEYRSCLVQAS